MDGLLRMLSRPAVARGAQLVLGIVFIAAGLAKVGNLGAFASQHSDADLAPPSGVLDFSDIAAFLTLFGLG